MLLLVGNGRPQCQQQLALGRNFTGHRRRENPTHLRQHRTQIAQPIPRCTQHYDHDTQGWNNLLIR